MFKSIYLKGLAFQILLILFAIEVFAMKPYRPEVLKFQSEKYGLELQLPRDQAPTLIKKEGIFLWKKTEKVTWENFQGEKHPGRVLFFPELERIVFLGGLGDPGVELGLILIIDFKGKVLKSLNASETLPHLEDMVRKYRKKPNFPWISGLQVKDSNQLIIDVCKEERILLNVDDMSITKQKFVDGETKNDIGTMTYDED